MSTTIVNESQEHKLSTCGTCSSMALIQMHVQVVFCGTLILCMQQSAEDGTKKAQKSLYPKLHCKIEKILILMSYNNNFKAFLKP